VNYIIQELVRTPGSASRTTTRPPFFTFLGWSYLSGVGPCRIPSDIQDTVLAFASTAALSAPPTVAASATAITPAIACVAAAADVAADVAVAACTAGCVS